MGDIFAAMTGSGIAVEDLAVRRPTLDEVFMELTGHPTAPETTTTDSEEAAA